MRSIPPPPPSLKSMKVASLPRLREMLEALATLAAGGVRLLRERQRALPAATLLLGHLGEGGSG